MRISAPCLGVAVMLTAACAHQGRTDPWGATPAVDHFDAWEHLAGYESRVIELDSVRLHYLEWDGDGPTLLFLAGGGQSAYVMSGLASQFASTHRVLALTRRGTGESGRPEVGYTVADHASDVVGFLDRLGVEQTIIVGHSMAGAEMTRVAERHPQRVAGLVYLDATYDYRGYAEMVAANPHPRPSPREFGYPTSASLRDYNRVHVYGFWSDSLEADLRVTFWQRTHPDLTTTFIEDATANPNNYSGVSAPSLAFFAEASFDDYAPGQAALASGEVREEMESYFEEVRLPWGRKGARRFEQEMENGRLIEVRANHHFFIPLEDMVVREIKAFLSSEVAVGSDAGAS